MDVESTLAKSSQVFPSPGKRVALATLSRKREREDKATVRGQRFTAALEPGRVTGLASASPFNTCNASDSA